MARPSPRSADAPADHPAAPARHLGDPPISEDIIVRNYDVTHQYTLHVRIEGQEDGSTFAWTYYLDPGEFRSELGVLDPGTYAVTVESESCGSDTATCEVGPDRETTIRIETGNHIVSVSAGLF